MAKQFWCSESSILLTTHFLKQITYFYIVLARAKKEVWVKRGEGSTGTGRWEVHELEDIIYIYVGRLGKISR